MKRVLAAIGVLLLSGCAQIERQRELSHELSVQQTAAIGSELYRISKTRDLPNVFGRADIWGGKVNEGYTELRYMGLSDTGQVVFRLTDIDIESNENVFTRYGGSTATVSSTTNANASVVGNSVLGNSQTNTTVNVRDKPEATITQLPPSTIEFEFDLKNRILPMEGVNIEVIEATSYSIRYILRESGG